MIIFFLSFFAFAESPNPPVAGRYEGRAIYSYYKSDSNYPAAGTSNLVGNGSLTQMQGDVMAIYDWQPDWRFNAGMNFGWVESDDGTYVRSDSGFNEIMLGGQKWFEASVFDIAPQADFVYPLWRPGTKNDDAIFGEGAMRVRAGGWFFWPLGTYKPFAYVGFEYRDGGRSFLVPYEAGVKIKFDHFWMQGSFRGFESVVDDSDTNNRQIREYYLRNANAGSLRYYSVNPSGSEAVAEAGTQFGSWGVFTGLAISVAGKSWADGWTAHAGISWSPTVVNTKKLDDGFSIRREHYDEELFEDGTTEPQFVEDPNFKEPKPKAKAPTPAPRPRREDNMQLELRKAPKNKKPPRKKKSQQNIDKMMNDAESALEDAR